MTALQIASLTLRALCYREMARDSLAQLARCPHDARIRDYSKQRRRGRMAPVWIRRAKQALRKARAIEAQLASQGVRP